MNAECCTELEVPRTRSVRVLGVGLVSAEVCGDIVAVEAKEHIQCLFARVGDLGVGKCYNPFRTFGIGFFLDARVGRVRPAGLDFSTFRELFDFLCRFRDRIVTRDGVMGMSAARDGVY